MPSPMSPVVRRHKLWEWMRDRDPKVEVCAQPTARECGELSGLYVEGHLVNPTARAQRDLASLERERKVRRIPHSWPGRYEVLLSDV
jgi:hypothetical protein